MKADFSVESIRRMFLGLGVGASARIGNATLARTWHGEFKFHTGEAPPAKWSVAYDDARDAAEACVAATAEKAAK